MKVDQIPVEISIAAGQAPLWTAASPTERSTWSIFHLQLVLQTMPKIYLLFSKYMKTIFILLALAFSIVAAQADLIMELSFDRMNLELIVKIKGEKARCDFCLDSKYEYMSRIVNLKTGENFNSDHSLKR